MPYRTLSAVVEQVCASAFFSQKRTLKRLIRHLATNEKSPGKRTAASIATALEIEASSVATQVKRANEALAALPASDSDGGQFGFSLSISGGGRGPSKKGHNYELVLTLPVLPITHRFWAPHIQATAPVDLVNNAPLFFRDGSRPTWRVRYMSVNDISNLPPDLAKFESCFHYMSVGDFRIATRLIHLLAAPPVGKEVNPWIVYGNRDLDDPYNPSENSSFNLASATNAVIVGNPRVSWVVRAALDAIKPNFYLTAEDSESVFNRRSQLSSTGDTTPSPQFSVDGSVSTLECAPPHFSDEMRSKHIVFAAVVRRCTDSRTETLLLVQNGPALDALSRVLCDDDELARVLGVSGFNVDSDEFPSNFELLFVVHLGRQDTPTTIDLALPGVKWWSVEKSERASAGGGR